MEFRVLGPLQVVRAGVEVEMPAGRQRTLLAALLLRPNRLVSTEELIARIWDRDPPRDARATTQTYVRRLRHTLGDPVIDTRPGGYAISVAADRLDLARFDDLLKRARRADHAEQEVALLAEALGLWRGPALANVRSDALHREEVPALTERRLRALERRLDLDLAAGRHADLVAEVQALVAAYPLRERFWAQLIAALAGCGRQAEALQAYEELRNRLADELGADPSPQLQALHRAILRGECGQPGRPPAEPAPAAVPPAQLPPDVAAFTGRTGDLQRLGGLLPAGDGSRPTAATVAVVEGMGGVGKTALTVHWGHQLRDRFPDGQLYVNLRGYAATAPVRPIDALAGFLHALSVPADQVPVELDEAAALYRSLVADKRLLVILDNAAGPDQVRPLLPGGGGCLVLVTSRSQLGGLVARDGAHRLVLDPLPPGDAHALLGRLLGEARVRAEPAAAAELAELCGYLPLALRIAVANLTMQPQQTLAVHVAQLRAADRPAALAVPGDEQAALPATFDLSYHRLPAAARRMFRLLGLAPGQDIGVAAAAALAGIPPEHADHLLRQLAEAYLLERPHPDRYALHDMLRAYAAGYAGREDPRSMKDDAVSGLLGYYLQTAAAAADTLYPQTMRLLPGSAPDADPPGTPVPNHRSALAWLDLERANLVAAVRHAAAHGPHRLAWLLADALRSYLYTSSRVVDGLAVAEAALAATQAGSDHRAQAAAHVSLANLHVRQREFPRAIHHFAQARELASRSGWLAGQAAVANNLGIVYLDLGRLSQAEARFTEALAVDRQISRDHAGPALSNLGTVCLAMGQLERAADHASRALAASLVLGDRNGAAINLTTLGAIDHVRGRLDRAAHRLGQALDCFRAVGNRAGESEAMRELALARGDAGQPGKALELAERALCLAIDTGSHLLQAGCLAVLGSLQPRPAEAVDCCERAIALVRDDCDPSPRARALIAMASAHQRLGDHARADACLRHAVAITRDRGFRLLEGLALTTLAGVRLDVGDLDGARDHGQAAATIYRETGHRLGEARTRAVLRRVRQCARRAQAITAH